MTCAEATRLLLEMDPGELAGGETGHTELATHLGDCARCRAAADRIIAAAAALRSDLSRPAPDASMASRRAVLEAQRRERQRRWVWRAGGPLAAAAVLAGVLVLRHLPVQPTVTPTVVEGAGYHGVTVTAPPGRNVAVLNSDSSNLVIIWFF